MMRTFLQFLCERTFIGGQIERYADHPEEFSENSTNFVRILPNDSKNTVADLASSDIDKSELELWFKMITDLVYSDTDNSELELWFRKNTNPQYLTTFVKGKKTNVSTLRFIVLVPSSNDIAGEIDRVGKAVIGNKKTLKDSIFGKNNTEIPDSEEPVYFFASSSEYSEIKRNAISNRGHKVRFNNIVKEFPKTTLFGKENLEFGLFSLEKSHNFLFSEMEQMEVRLLALVRINFQAKEVSKNEASRIYNVGRFLNLIGLSNRVERENIDGDAMDVIKTKFQEAFDAGEISQNDLSIHGRILDMIREAKPDNSGNFDLKSALTSLDMKKVMMNQGVKGYFPVISEYMIPFLLLKNITKLNGTDILGNFSSDDQIKAIEFPVSSSNPLTDYYVITALTENGKRIRVSAKVRHGNMPSILRYFELKNPEDRKIYQGFKDVCKNKGFSFENIGKLTNAVEEYNGDRVAQIAAFCDCKKPESEKDANAISDLEAAVVDKCKKINEDTVFKTYLYIKVTKWEKDSPFVQIELNEDFSIKTTGDVSNPVGHYNDVIKFEPDSYKHGKSGMIRFSLLD